MVAGRLRLPPLLSSLKPRSNEILALMIADREAMLGGRIAAGQIYRATNLREAILSEGA